MIRMHSMVRAPVLSATLSRVCGWITPRLLRPGVGRRLGGRRHRPRRSRRRPSACSRPGWAAAWIASAVSASSATTLAGQRRARRRARRLSTRRQRLVADSGRDSSMRTVSPTWASFASSWALNFVRQADDALVERVARQALDGHDDRLVHLVADDAADLRLPLALHRGASLLSSRDLPSRRLRASSRSLWTVRIRAIVRRVCGIVL